MTKRDRFNFTKRAAYYLIDAAEVVNNLKMAYSTRNEIASEPDTTFIDSPKSEQFVHSYKSTILPTRESQCRHLSGHSVEVQRKAWDRALEMVAYKKAPPAKVVKQAVLEITQNNQREPNLTLEAKGSIEPSFREVTYKAGTGIEYTIKLDEETFYRLKTYQDKIGSATKCGAIARLLDGVKPE